jgi:nucleotide-binding universal stress UspA family protein
LHVALDLRVIGGHPVAALAAHSSDVDAEAIVVGARGHGQFGELTIGRVPRQLLHTAARPVIIVGG